MIRWLQAWRLRRVQAKIDWIQETIWTDQIRLTALESKERAVQAELWCVESPRALLSDRDSGLSARG